METKELPNTSNRSLLKKETLSSLISYAAKKGFNKIFFLMARLFLGFVFIYAAVNKIVEPQNFVESLTNYRLFPYFTINFIAIVLPWIELFSGVLLLFGAKEKESASIIAALLIIFTIVVLISMARGLDFECGCYGTGKSDRIGLKKILENLFLLILCYAVISKDKILPKTSIKETDNLSF
jgi:uncharacterized membrane protein YphA (DoxX/SURF4 family)